MTTMLERMMTQANTPSKRTNKHRSGRQGRKQYSAREELRRVRGQVRHLDAIFLPADIPLCATVPTDEVGWTTDGRPFRSPQHHDRINGTSAPQRGC